MDIVPPFGLVVSFIRANEYGLVDRAYTLTRNPVKISNQPGSHLWTNFDGHYLLVIMVLLIGFHDWFEAQVCTTERSFSGVKRCTKE